MAFTSLNPRGQNPHSLVEQAKVVSLADVVGSTDSVTHPEISLEQIPLSFKDGFLWKINQVIHKSKTPGSKRFNLLASDKTLRKIKLQDSPLKFPIDNRRHLRSPSPDRPLKAASVSVGEDKIWDYFDKQDRLGNSFDLSFRSYRCDSSDSLSQNILLVTSGDTCQNLAQFGSTKGGSFRPMAGAVKMTSILGKECEFSAKTHRNKRHPPPEYFKNPAINYGFPGGRGERKRSRIGYHNPNQLTPSTSEDPAVNATTQKKRKKIKLLPVIKQPSRVINRVGSKRIHIQTGSGRAAKLQLA